MAVASASSTVHLVTKEFPSEFENVFSPRSQSPKQNTAAEKVMVAGADRRQRIMSDNERGYPSIGLLRMEFNGMHSMGTATIIAQGSCLLTCAHNVVDYDEITKEFLYPTSVWFELRENKPGSGSSLLKQYKVTKTAVYPPYFENPTSASGFDLALCWIHVPEDDHSIKGSDHPEVLSGVYGTNTAAVVGFPGEHKGEKWGMVGRSDKWWRFGPDPFRSKDELEEEEKDILVYDFIDTSPGQSGSPIMGVQSGDILGVHTGGSATRKKNWGTHITPTKLKWITSTLGSQWKILSDYGTLYIRE